jgi:hypothetical protein
MQRPASDQGDEEPIANAAHAEPVSSTYEQPHASAACAGLAEGELALGQRTPERLHEAAPAQTQQTTTAQQLATEIWSESHALRCLQLLGDPICRRLAIYALPPTFVLSVIVPIYNEVGTVDDLVDRLRATRIPMQIILVDDGSSDGTAERIAGYAAAVDVVLLSHGGNRGKGAAIRTALAVATGTIVVIQDADREYDPDDFRYLMQPILEDRADVVYGTRYGHADRQVSPLWHELVNAVITKLTNLALGIRLSDVETCYKMARRDVWAAIEPELRENRFGIEIELTARWARRQLRFHERPIRYQHRWYAEGKKIGWRDGVSAIACVIRYGLLRW